MKYESDIAEMIHENAMENFKLGFISEARIREYDKLCLTPKALKEKIANGDNNTHEPINIEHAELATA